MKSKKFTFTLLSLLFCFFISTSLFSQRDSCCTVPDSLHVISKTDSSFCLGWKIHIPDSCKNKPFKVTVNWRNVDSTTWLSYHFNYTFGTTDTSFCSPGVPGTKYQWRLKHTCKDSLGNTYNSTWIKGSNFTLDTISTLRQSINLISSHPAPKNLTLSKLYPNPARNVVSIEGVNNIMGNVKVIVTTLTGSRVLIKTINATTGKLNMPIDISALPKGNYFVTVTDGKEQSVLKLLKQ